MSIIDMKMPRMMEESNNWSYWFWEKGRAAENTLQDSAYLELRNVSCDFHQGILTLRGWVPSYYLKQMAQSILSAHEGILEVNNLLVVN
jgi:hypothetical protein